MKKTTSTGVASDIRIARGGNEFTVSFREGMTVNEALSAAEISLSSSEETYVKAVPANGIDVLEPGDLLQIIGKYEGGLV